MSYISLSFKFFGNQLAVIAFHQFYELDTELDLHWIMSGCHGSFATSVACQQGTLTLSDTWFRSPFLRLGCAPIVWDQIPRTYHVFTQYFTLNTPLYFLDFPLNFAFISIRPKPASLIFPIIVFLLILSLLFHRKPYIFL